MTLAEDLQRLETLDPTTYVAWRMSMDQLRTFARFSIKDEDPLSLAWLQWCIQKAIKARDWWTYEVAWDLAEMKDYAKIVVVNPDTKIVKFFEAYGSTDCLEYVGSPAEALLSAYRQALEAQ